jgi:hypothetical protein
MALLVFFFVCRGEVALLAMKKAQPFISAAVDLQKAGCGTVNETM